MISQSLVLSFRAGLMHEVLNHLWQSTLFAAILVLIALAFTKNQARTRFCLWMAGSVKFLIPFSTLVWVGRHLGWSAATPATLRWSFAVEDLSRPFTQPHLMQAVARPGLADSGIENWFAIVWVAGFVAVLGAWALRWYRLRRLVGSMSPITEGPAFDTFQRLRRNAGVRLLSSPSTLEPGVFGIFRPALVLPAGVLERLSEIQLEAVIRHELCHVRRRDNLSAVLHMLVEAIFWFHPLVWWLGTRLVNERERACDEAVLDEFNQPQVYAQGILKVCEFYLESSVPCVAGVTGADLRKRIEDIMNQRMVNKPGLGRRLLLWTAGAAAIVCPITVGLLDAPQGRAQSNPLAPKQFEVASIKPMDPAMGGMHRVEIQMAPGGRFIAKGLNAKMLIQQAYGVRDFQISGAPSWASTDRYEINAKGEGNITRDDLKPMLQALLADRFKLTIQRETKDMPVYNLVVAKGGPKLKESEGGKGDQVRMGRGLIEAQSASMLAITNVLSNQLGHAILDKTGLTGRYDLKLEWTPDESQTAMIRQMHPDSPPPPPLDNGGPSIYTALQEQLGLKLENSKGPVDMLVITRLEKPTEN